MSLGKPPSLSKTALRNVRGVQTSSTVRAWRRALDICLRRPSRDVVAADPQPAAAVPVEAGPLSLSAAALEALPDAVLIISGDRPSGGAGLRLVTSNPSARELLRIRSEGEERLVSVLRHPEILEAADDTLFEGAPHSLAYETGGAQARYWRVWTKPLPVFNGRRFALLVLRDETNERRHERMRVDFLANASHELRTPLASLAGFIETLRGHAKDDPAARDRFLGIMAAQAQRMGRLINDLLSLSRIELNEHVPPCDVCDVALTAGEAADAIAPMLEAKRVRLKLIAPPSGQALSLGDRDQIAQVVQNLLDNAVKYSPPGATVSLEVAARAPFEAPAQGAKAALLRESGGGRLALISPERAHANQYVSLAIADQGTGMAREHLPRLTERFYRVPGQKSGEPSGTGLGLAIVKHIVNRHRGGLVVESSPGRGTAFTVYLPLNPGAPPPAPPVPTPQVASVTESL